MGQACDGTEDTKEIDVSLQKELDSGFRSKPVSLKESIYLTNEPNRIVTLIIQTQR